MYQTYNFGFQHHKGPIVLQTNDFTFNNIVNRVTFGYRHPRNIPHAKCDAPTHLVNSLHNNTNHLSNFKNILLTQDLGYMHQTYNFGFQHHKGPIVLQTNDFTFNNIVNRVTFGYRHPRNIPHAKCDAPTRLVNSLHNNTNHLSNFKNILLTQDLGYMHQTYTIPVGIALTDPNESFVFLKPFNHAVKTHVGFNILNQDLPT